MVDMLHTVVWRGGGGQRDGYFSIFDHLSPTNEVRSSENSEAGGLRGMLAQATVLYLSCCAGLASTFFLKYLIVTGREWDLP